MKKNIKYPSVSALEEARKSLKELINRKPSEELIRIINENNRLIDLEDGVVDRNQDDDRAAKLRDVDL